MDVPNLSGVDVSWTASFQDLFVTDPMFYVSIDDEVQSFVIGAEPADLLRTKQSCHLGSRNISHKTSVRAVGNYVQCLEISIVSLIIDSWDRVG